MSRPTSHVEVRGVSKRFGGVQALADVTLSVEHASVHALVGENGAGKSTLGKVIAGVHRADAGELFVDGAPCSFGHPLEAQKHGITIIAQELALVPQRSVLDNVFLGDEPTRWLAVNRRRQRRRYADLDALTGFGIPDDVVAGSLTVADQQKVEILRTLARDAKLIVMDEPTAALARTEAERLLDVVRWLREHGTTVVYVSHFLNEVLAIADDVTVLRDGRVIRSGAASEQTPESLVTAMLGRTLDVTFPPRTPPPDDAPAILTVRGLARGSRIGPLDFDARAGEILGIAGLVGSGRSELARLLFGAERRTNGSVHVNGRPVPNRGVPAALAAGIALLPENRKEGLLFYRSIAANIALPHLKHVGTYGIVRRRSEARASRPLLQRLDVRGANELQPIATLSGGNQQKAMFAKWLLRTPNVLIADEPTRGIDVGAKRGIYELLGRLAAEGMAVLLISSELEEITGLAHRVLVMARGRIVDELVGSAVNLPDVMHAVFDLAAGSHPAAARPV
jgi:simple sugar transport system ATP-binding protein/ribose transport system ATP-binding protein